MVAPDGRLRVVLETDPSAGGRYSARILAGGDELAFASGRTPDQARSVTLDMWMNGAGVAMLAASPARLPALLETSTRRPDGQVCRSSSPALLRFSSD
jgi:hypothetical protein